MLMVANVNAAEGPGDTGGGWVHKGCSVAVYHQNKEECSGNKGGASWHIFKKNNTPVPGWSGYVPNRPLYGVFGGYGYDGLVGAKCVNSDYYLAYVYDGWVGAGNGTNANAPVYYFGPLSWGNYADPATDGSNTYHYPQYHRTWSASYVDIMNAIARGQNVDGVRVYGTQPYNYEYSVCVKKDSNGKCTKTEKRFYWDPHYVSAEAGKFWNLWNDPTSWSVPAGVGYFCARMPDEYEGRSDLRIRVKNYDIDNYNKDDLKEVYARPGNTVEYKTDYSPNAQSGINREAQYLILIHNNGAEEWRGGSIWHSTARSLFSNYSGRGNWDNKVTINNDNTPSWSSFSFSDSIGSSPGNTGHLSNTNKYQVEANDAGSALSEKAATTAGTPSYVKIQLSRPYYDSIQAKIGVDAEDIARAYVPYNFETGVHKPNRTEDDPDGDENDSVNDGNSEKVVYAGEEDTFEFNIDVYTRKNPVTEGDYATIVRNAKWRVGLCIGETACNNNSYDYSETVGNLNENYNLNGETGIPHELNINIPDLPAGSRICVRAETYPRFPGPENDRKSYTNWNDTDYTGADWAVSSRSCYTIAKRPAIQIWGGNVFSRGNLITSTAIKNNLAGYSDYTYSAQNKKGTFVFGSWGELGVVGNGIINGFGSGASMGYASNGIGGLSPNPFAVNTASVEPGGGTTSDYCKRIPLTIPNTPCEENGVRGFTSAVSITKAASDKESIISVLASDNGSTDHIHNPGRAVDKSVVGEIIDGNTIKVVSSDDDIVISGDLIYLDESYLRYEQMPKLVIFAKGNIYINCGVTRIDALLIANDTVVTCNNFEDYLSDANVKKHINDPDNSNQLLVNGTVIARKILANRTYGAATGANSIVPAEILNFDPTLYQFGGNDNDSGDATGRLDVTYIHELPPRL